MLKRWLWMGLWILACSMVSCHVSSPATETPAGERLATQDLSSDEEREDDVVFYKYAPTVDAKKEDVLKALQGEWSSKENGFNYKIIISGNTMQIGYSDFGTTEMAFEIEPGMPMEIIPDIPMFDQTKGRGYASMYSIEKIYYINDRMVMIVKSLDSYYQSEDELVLSRGLERDALRDIEPAEPQPNLVFNDKSVSNKDVLKAIQGEWTGRDNCNYEITIENDQFQLWNMGNPALMSKLHLSKDNPAHIELESTIIDKGYNHDDLFGVYYLNDHALLLSIRSSFMGDKFEYVLRRPEDFGRYVMDDKILPLLQGKWVDGHRGDMLTIRGNEIEYHNKYQDIKDTFHVVTMSSSDIEDNTYYLVGTDRAQRNRRSILNQFESMKFDGQMIKTFIPVMDAQSPEFMFVHVPNDK